MGFWGSGFFFAASGVNVLCLGRAVHFAGRGMVLTPKPTWLENPICEPWRAEGYKLEARQVQVLGE